MTNSRQHQNGPTKPQIELLKDLTEQTDGSFAWPATSGEASKEIRRLLKEKKTPGADRRRERRELDRSFAERSGDAAAFRDDELAGYGSTASWAGHRG
jgi:hypothetical protein